MFDPQQKPTGTQYTMTIALVAVAAIFSPAVLVLSSPFGIAGLSAAISCSGICAGLAWLNWTRNARLTMPSIELAFVKVK